jgi:hypothetical protein
MARAAQQPGSGREREPREAERSWVGTPGVSFAGVLKFSSGELIAALVLGVVFAVLGYWLSENDRRRFGRTPWGLPSGVWALFWFISLLLGLILYLIAHADVVRRARQFPGGRLPDMGPRGPGPIGAGPAAAPTPPSVADNFPAYPRPANVPAGGPPPPQPATAQGPTPHPAPAEPAVSQIAPPDGASISPPAWHPDPGGRFHYRWWDGREWTSYVSFNGQQLIDTSPDQRIGPY